MEIKGVRDKDIDRAQSRLRGHLFKVVSILNQQKNQGKDIDDLAKRLDDRFDPSKIAISKFFRKYRKSLKEKERALEKQLEESRQKKDYVQEEIGYQELVETQTQYKILENRVRKLRRY